MAKRKRNLKEALSREQFNAKKRKQEEAAEATAAASKNSKGKGKEKPPPPKAWIPFNDSEAILLLGEGNFSFAVSLLEHHIPEAGGRMVATSFDSLEVANQKYDDLESNVEKLREHGATVLFGVDAGALAKTKALRNKTFDKVVFNYPHVGAGEKDEQRNVTLNQTLLLRFLRSVANFLTIEPSTLAFTSEIGSDDEDAPKKASQSSRKGSVLVTLRDCKPYTLWNLPSLAKKGPVFAASLLKDPQQQPTYSLVRSGAFDPALYPGYAHRRTIGFRPGVSFEKSEDVLLAAKSRRGSIFDTAKTVTVSKTYQLQLN